MGAPGQELGLTLAEECISAVWFRDDGVMYCLSGRWVHKQEGGQERLGLVPVAGPMDAECQCGFGAYPDRELL